MTSSIALFCLIHGQPIKNAFPVEIEKTRTVGHLKEEILRKNLNAFHGVDAAMLILWKVHIEMKKDDINAVPDVPSTANDTAYELAPFENIEDVFTDPKTKLFITPAPKHIHIIIQALMQVPQRSQTLTPQQLIKASPPVSPSKLRDHITPRTETVKNLYYRLKENKVIHVKGTPFIGKTTLLKLLYFHIKEVEPEMTCARIIAWPKTDVQDAGKWRKYITKETEGHIDTNQSTPFVLFIDEAQGTYWDEDFWADFVKELAQGTWHSSEHYLIMFSCYGLRASTLPENPTQGTPVRLNSKQTVTLLPSPETEKSFPVGLLFNREEFNDALYRALAKPAHGAGAFIGEKVEDALFTVTQALTMAFLEEHLFSNFSEMFNFLLQHGITRGLPGSDDITQPEITKIFEIILTQNGLITPRTLPPKEIAAFQVCYRSGWIQAEINYRSKSQTTYVMASKLHEWYMRLLLFSVYDTLSWSIPYAAPIELAIQVIKKFRPPQLKAGMARMKMQMGSEVMGAGGSYRPLEAVFQDEFYRCLYQVCSGCIVAVPEFGNSSGRIDFFIPKVKWGIEIMRFGLKQAEHIQRFDANGRYGPWIRTAQMTQYVIVNFTTTMPAKSNGIEHLYHVVFMEDYQHAEIIKDRGLTWIAKKFRLLEV